MRKKKVSDKTATHSKPAGGRVDPREPDLEAVHSPVKRTVPAWFYDRRQYEKAEKIEDWMTRGLSTHEDFTLPKICTMLGVSREFVFEVCEFFDCPRPLDAPVPPKVKQPDTAQTHWVSKPKPVDDRAPASKGGPQWVKRRHGVS